MKHVEDSDLSRQAQNFFVAEARRLGITTFELVSLCRFLLRRYADERMGAFVAEGDA